MQKHIFNVNNGRFFQPANGEETRDAIVFFILIFLILFFFESVFIQSMVTANSFFGGTYQWGFSVWNVLNEFTKKIHSLALSVLAPERMR